MLQGPRYARAYPYTPCKVQKKKKLPPPVEVPGNPLLSFVNQYMPDATPDKKEEACYNLEQFVKVLIGIDERLERGKQSQSSSNNSSDASG